MLIRTLIVALILSISSISSQALAFMEGVPSVDIKFHYVPASIADGYSRDATLTLSSTDDLDISWGFDDDSSMTAITEGNQTDSCPPTSGQACLTHQGNGIYIIEIDASLVTESGKMLCIDVQDVQGTRTVGDVELCKWVYPEDRWKTSDEVGTDSAATASALATAQTDLDTLTGSDGATLATAQGNYAPSKAGDLMGLANDAITAAKIAADAIGASEIAANAIGASEIATDAIGAAEIAASAINASEAPNLDVAVSTNATPTEVQAELVTYDAVVPGDLVSASDVADAVFAQQTFCNISASTSGTSFTIASCTDHQGNSLTPDTDSFVGGYMKAYTNGGSDCNVVGESVFVSDLTANVVTVRTSDMPGSGFSATPNTSNCGVIVIP